MSEHHLYRMALSHLLASSGAVEVTGESEHSAQAVEQWRRLRPDVVLLDSSDNDDHFEAILALLGQIRDTPLVVLSNRLPLPSLVAGGLAGYLMKNARIEELLHAIARVRQGERFIDPRLKDSVSHTVFRTRQRPRGQVMDLSKREEQVLRSIVHGFTNVETARRLKLSLKTVETYRSRLCKKLGLRTRADLVIYAATSGLIPSMPSEN